MSTLEDIETWRGKKMVDADGDKIGTIEAVFLDRQTGQPAWAAVKTGLFGHKHTLVPIRDAQVTDDDQVRVPLDKEQVKDAPRIDPDGELSLTKSAGSGSTTACRTTTSGRATIAPPRLRCPIRTRTGRGGRPPTPTPTAVPPSWGCDFAASSSRRSLCLIASRAQRTTQPSAGRRTSGNRRTPCIPPRRACSCAT